MTQTLTPQMAVLPACTRLAVDGQGAPEEGLTLAALYAFVAEQGLEPAGPHSEVYLNDPSRTAPADVRTEIRVPVR